MTGDAAGVTLSELRPLFRSLRPTTPATLSSGNGPYEVFTHTPERNDACKIESSRILANDEQASTRTLTHTQHPALPMLTFHCALRSAGTIGARPDHVLLNADYGLSQNLLSFSLRLRVCLWVDSVTVSCVVAFAQACRNGNRKTQSTTVEHTQQRYAFTLQQTHPLRPEAS